MGAQVLDELLNTADTERHDFFYTVKTFNFKLNFIKDESRFDSMQTSFTLVS